MMEDLGLQMNVNSTLGSYLQRLVWLLTGHYARPGTNNAFVPLLSLARAEQGRRLLQGAPLGPLAWIGAAPWPAPRSSSA